MENITQQKIKLVLKSRKDFKFYIENFLHIETSKERVIDYYPDAKPIKGSIYPLRFNDEQNLIYKEFLKQKNANKPIRLIILKPRQIGSSTFCCALAFSWTMLYPNIRTIMIAHREYASLRLLSIIKLFYEGLPEYFKPSLLVSPRRQMIFDNSVGDGLKSHIMVGVSADKASGRATTNNVFIASELSEWDFPEETMLSILQTVPDIPKSMIIFEGTGKGYGGYFHQQWLLAKEGRIDMQPVFIPWFLCKSYRKKLNAQWYDIPLDSVERYQPEQELKKKFMLTDEQLFWRRWAIDNKCQQDPLKFCQEYPATDEEAFITTNMNVFNTMKLQKLLLRVTKGEQCRISDTGFTSDPMGNWEVWERPVKNVKYIIGVDTASGIKGGDLSVIEIIRADNLSQVAEFASDEIDTTNFSHIVLESARLYNNAFIVIEVNGPGIGVLDNIKDVYYNLYMWERFDEFGKVITRKLGFVTNAWSKPLLIRDLQDYIMQDLGEIRSYELIVELMYYQQIDRKRTGSIPGYTDDRLMAFGFCLRGYRSNQLDWRETTLSELSEHKEDKMGIISPYSVKADGSITVSYPKSSTTTGIYSPYGVIS